MLVNENVQLPAPYDELWLCGLDNPEEGAPDADAAFAGAEGTRLVLMHSPDGLRWIGERPFAVAFCGHTHGGQFYWRGKSMLNFKGPLSREYLKGGLVRLGERGERIMVVSRGVGQGSLPMRLGADPEVHVCTLDFAPPRS
jgi:predicted MPP superfamily phosphohydrolase